MSVDRKHSVILAQSGCSKQREPQRSTPCFGTAGDDERVASSTACTFIENDDDAIWF